MNEVKWDCGEMSDKLQFVDETRHRRNLKAKQESDKLKFVGP